MQTSIDFEVKEMMAWAMDELRPEAIEPEREIYLLGFIEALKAIRGFAIIEQLGIKEELSKRLGASFENARDKAIRSV